MLRGKNLSLSVASMVTRITKADKMNKDFFATHNERAPCSSLRAIRNDFGTLHSHPDMVLSLASYFDEKLFTADVPTFEIPSARRIVWSHTACDCEHGLDFNGTFLF